jgi:hypothetical protein
LENLLLGDKVGITIKPKFDIKKFFKEREESITIRGEIIETAIFIEGKVNFLIASYFSDESVHSEFLEDFLMDRSCHYNLRINVLGKILKKINYDSKYIRDIIERLHKMNGIRNLVAHSEPYLDSNKNPVSGYTIFDTKKVKGVEVKNLKEEERKMNDYFEEVYIALAKIKEKMVAVKND